VAAISEKMQLRLQADEVYANPLPDTGTNEEKWSYSRQLLPWSGYLSKRNYFADFVLTVQITCQPDRPLGHQGLDQRALLAPRVCRHKRPDL
jgi:hypothetical protein